jgi:flagellar basal body-associated protein FliL
MSSAGNSGDDRQGYEVGRGAAGRKKIIALIIGVIIGAFVVLLLIWLLASGNDASEGAPAAPADGLASVVSTS